MKKLNLRINFFWDDGDDICEFVLTVPDNVTELEVSEILSKEHHHLCFEDDEDLYGIQGREPETLLDYTCEKYGWSWTDFKFDIDVGFD